MPTQNTQFSYQTWGSIQLNLAQRLNDVGNVFWTKAENILYLTEALQFWNVLTSYWPQDYTFTPPSLWSYTNLTGSPRQQTYTEADLYSFLCYHLMEPQMTAGVWNGTVQFTTNDFHTALQQNRDQVLQATASNISYLDTVSILPNSYRTYLPDSVLDVRRVRYNGQDGTNKVLFKGDSDSFLRFSPTYRQQTGTPRRYDFLGSPPLALTVDIAPSQPNFFELLVMSAGNTLNPTNPQPLQLPNDWMFVIKWAVLADLLAKEPESTDRHRSDYCQKRFMQGLKLIQSAPWILNAFINEQAVDAVPVIGKDRYNVDWQNSPTARPSIVIGGTDIISYTPNAFVGYGVGGFGDGGFGGVTNPPSIRLTMVGNAPIPATDADFLQAPRDLVNLLIDYAQHLAKFKCAGSEFEETIPLYQNLVDYALETNSRLRESGIFPTDLRPTTSRQELSEPRYSIS